VGTKRGGWDVNSRHKKFINGRKKGKKKEYSGKIKKYLKEERGINNAKKRKERVSFLSRICYKQLKSLHGFSGSSIFINKIIGKI
jgi:hypothetical protein